MPVSNAGNHRNGEVIGRTPTQRQKAKAQPGGTHPAPLPQPDDVRTVTSSEGIDESASNLRTVDLGG